MFYLFLGLEMKDRTKIMRYLGISNLGKVFMADLPNAPKPTEDERLVICVGVEFYQQVGTQFYLYRFYSGFKQSNEAR